MWSRHLPKMQPLPIPGTCLSVRGAWLGWWEEPHGRANTTRPESRQEKSKNKSKTRHLRSKERLPGGGMIFPSEYLRLWDWELTCEQKGS